MDLYDTHCHLNLPDAFPDPDAVIEEANAALVTRLNIVGIDLESCNRAIEIAERHKGVNAIVGWHPNSAANYDANALRAIKRMLSHPKVVALGEIGLDYHWDFATKEQQFRCLYDQLDLAASLKKPVVFHCRDANDDLLNALESRPKHPCLFHCFSGDSTDSRRALDLGGILGFDGPITYKRADELRQLLASLPEDRFVLETDSPYMPPEPHRGKPNKPAYVAIINQAAARCRGISDEDCAKLTTANARRFFGV